MKGEARARAASHSVGSLPTSCSQRTTRRPSSARFPAAEQPPDSCSYALLSNAPPDTHDGSTSARRTVHTSSCPGAHTQGQNTLDSATRPTARRHLKLQALRLSTHRGFNGDHRLRASSEELYDLLMTITCGKHQQVIPSLLGLFTSAPHSLARQRTTAS